MDIPAPPITRSVNEEIMNHLLNTCMRLNERTASDEHPIRHAISAMQIEFVEDLYSFSLPEIKAITWQVVTKSEDTSPTTTTHSLNGGYANQVYALRNMVADVLDRTNFNPTKDNFLELSRPDYMMYLRNQTSVLDIKLPVFSGGKLLSIDSYMEHFPFQHYIVLRDVNNLPRTLSDALRQWFELVLS